MAALAEQRLLLFVARRAVIGLVLVFAAAALVFAATEVLPGDAAEAMLGEHATEEQIAVVRDQLGLDRPLIVRYFEWLRALGTGDLGVSMVAGGITPQSAITLRIPVTRLIAEPATNTLILGIVTIAALIPLSIVLGVLAGMRPGGKLDQVISVFSLAALAVPEFVVGTVLILFIALDLRLLPPVSLLTPGTSPLSDPRILVLPVMTLIIASLGFTTPQIRAGIVEAMRSDYVQMARLNGVRESRVIFHWALRNSIAPAIQTVTQALQYLLGGAVLVEFIFSYPGLGRAMVTFVAARDIPVIQAVAIFIAMVYVGLNVLADVLVILVVPKARTSL